MDTTIHPRAINELLLDPYNPRLGLRNAISEKSNDELLAMMGGHSLEELGQSFLENGYWPQEALLCIPNASGKFVVVEGNRRLAALILLKHALEGNAASGAWERLADGKSAPAGLFDKIPTLLLDSRESVDIYLGYRHVTGIKEWQPAEKAEYISYLIETKGLTFEEVTKKIGSRVEAVKRNYLAYRVYKQADKSENVDSSKIVSKFSVLFLALKSSGVQKFLDVNITGDMQPTDTPVPDDHIDNLREFVEWLFGTETKKPIVKDSREVDRFARVLQSDEALKYLRTASKPSLEHAYVVSGGEALEIRSLLSSAAFDVEQSLTVLHLYDKDSDIKSAAIRLIKAARRVEQIFPIEEEG